MGCWQKIFLLGLFMMFGCDPIPTTTTEPEVEPEPETEPKVEPESGAEPEYPASAFWLLETQFNPQPEQGFGNFGFGGFPEPEPERWG